MPCTQTVTQQCTTSSKGQTLLNEPPEDAEKTTGLVIGTDCGRLTPVP